MCFGAHRDSDNVDLSAGMSAPTNGSSAGSDLLQRHNFRRDPCTVTVDRHEAAVRVDPPLAAHKVAVILACRVDEHPHDSPGVVDVGSGRLGRARNIDVGKRTGRGRRKTRGLGVGAFESSHNLPGAVDAECQGLTRTPWASNVVKVLGEVRA